MGNTKGHSPVGSSGVIVPQANTLVGRSALGVSSCATVGKGTASQLLCKTLGAIVFGEI